MSKHYFLPKGWREFALEDFLIPTLRKIEKPSSAYKRLGIRSHGKGTFVAEVDDPDDVAMDYLYQVKKDDLIVNITFGWEGAIAIVKETDEEALVSHRFPTYVFNRNLVIPEYFQYVIRAKQFIHQLGMISPGGAGRNRVLDKKDFLKLRVILPDTDEQKKIFETIAAWDNTITLSENLVVQKRKLKNKLAKQLLSGEIHFDKVTQTEWREVSLGAFSENDIFIKDGDWVESKDQDPNGKIRLIQLADVGDGVFINKSKRYMSDEKAKKLNCTFLQKDDILVARMPDPIGRSCLFPGIPIKAVTVVDVCILRINSENKLINNHWLMHKINSTDFRKKINRHASGTTRERISRNNLQNIKFLLPSHQEQLKQASFLSAMDTEINLYLQKINVLRRQRQALTMNLLAGQIRVKV